jgi:ribosomal protein S4
MVNGSRCNIPSRMINVGEVISLKEKARESQQLLKLLLYQREMFLSM